jgi:hypothetical protein
LFILIIFFEHIKWNKRHWQLEALMTAILRSRSPNSNLSSRVWMLYADATCPNRQSDWANNWHHTCTSIKHGDGEMVATAREENNPF